MPITGGLKEYNGRQMKQNDREGMCVAFIQRHADVNGDKMPNEYLERQQKPKIRLPPATTKAKIFDQYVADCNPNGVPGMQPYHLNHFYKVWNKHCSEIVIAMVIYPPSPKFSRKLLLSPNPQQCRFSKLKFLG